MPTVRDLIDEALIRHWSFTERKMPPGAMLLFLNRRQRKLLLELSPSIEGLVGVAAEVAAVVSGALVGVDADGNLYQTTTLEDGYAVHVDVDGNLYVDPTEAPVAVDPFGASGGTPGFPLPESFVKAIHAAVTLSDGSVLPLAIVSERERSDAPHGRDPAAFVNGNRLVPIRHAMRAGQDDWSDVESLSLSYIAAQTFTALADEVTLPDVLCEALVAGLAEQLALSAKPTQVSPVEKRMFVEQRAEAEAALRKAADRILGDLADDQVIFNG